MTNWYTAESYWTKSSCLRNLPGSPLCQRLYGKDFKKLYCHTVSLADILRSNEKWRFSVSFVTLKIASSAVSCSILIPGGVESLSCLWSREVGLFLHGWELPWPCQQEHAIDPGTLPNRPRETSFLSMPWICITRALAPELVPCVSLARRSHGDVPSAGQEWWPFTVSWPCRHLCPQVIRLFQCSLPTAWQMFQCFCQTCLDAY